MTSPDSSCPTREQGEPCLTLDQYTANPSLTSTVTLVMESGNHVLKQPRELSGSTVTNFTMISENAKIIFEFTGSLTMINRGYAELRGITFSISNSMYAEICANSLQEVIFQDCNFQGVGIYMYNVDNAAFSRCNFSDYYYRYYWGALYLSYTYVVSVIQSNFINNTGAIYFQPRYSYSSVYRYSTSLVIMKCKFINNTSEYNGGGAIHVTGNYFSVVVNQSTFIHNTASRNQFFTASRNQGEGGAINFDGECTNCNISESILISNYAHYCGALSVGILNFDGANDITVTDSAFYYNRAVDELSSGGGAACINDASVSITNCTFVGNIAAGLGGALLADNSEITITDTVFSNNTAGLSGGALITYAYPSNYTIISSTFIDNRAEDDGGALFIGHTGSNVIIEASNFLQNHAGDRGGAIAVFGSSVAVYYRTNVYDNTANIGYTISACSSQIYLSIVAVRQPDPTFFSCVAYNNDIHFSIPTFQELQSYQNVTLLVNRLLRDNDLFANPTVNVRDTDSQQIQSVNSKLHKTTVVVYISLSLSVILTVIFLLFGIVALVVYCKSRQAKLESKTRSSHHAYNQPELVYEDMLDGNYKVDTKSIEMKKNVVYERP